VAKDTLKIPTMAEYAASLVGANVGAKLGGKKGGIIAASKGASTLKKIIKGK
jgi:hypothetical protein